jgi:hypothetical protein
MSDDKDTESFPDAFCQRETSSAVLVAVYLPGGRQRSVWVPKSVIADTSEVFDAGDHASGTLILLSWFCTKEGLS